MRKTRLIVVVMSLFMVQLFWACRGDDKIVPSTGEQVTEPNLDVKEIKGFFLLNEGNMGSNKATLDYFDYESGRYEKNIYAERNPNVVKELGDVGNDIQIYGDRLYAVINCSNIVEVMDVNTATHTGLVSVPNCRYITFKDKYAYVSSYAGPVMLDPNARLGYVAKVDIETLAVVDTCVVGYQPEEIVVAGDKLYVANSGGYRAPNYDRTVSVIDLNTFEEIKKIDVAINLHRLELDNYGCLWVSSRGDYGAVASKTFVIDTKTDEVVKEFNLANSNMTCVGDSLYVHSMEWNNATGENDINYAIVDTKTQEIVDNNIIKDGTETEIEKPYSLAVNPETKDIYITDAKNYVTPGTLYCYGSDGKHKWSVTTGDIPAHIVFTNKKLK